MTQGTYGLHPGPYQEADRDIIDYQYFRLPGLPYAWRGPRPESLETGSFFCTLGAAQTFGRFCADPYPTQVARKVAKPVLNLGYSGAGPLLYLHHPELLEPVNRSAFVVVQVMSGRSEGNSLMRCDSGRNLVTWTPTGEECFTGKAFRYLMAEYGEKTVKSIVAETRENWVRHMSELLNAIKVPTLLLWFSEREAKYKERYSTGKLYDVFGKFPQLINESMMRKVRRRADAYAEAISARGIPHQLTNRFTGAPAKVRFPNGEYRGEDRSYPSPEMHDDAAAALAPVIQRSFLER